MSQNKIWAIRFMQIFLIIDWPLNQLSTGKIITSVFTCVGLKWINVNTRLGHACHTRVTRVFLACDTRVTRVEDVKVHGDSTVSIKFDNSVHPKYREKHKKQVDYKT